MEADSDNNMENDIAIIGMACRVPGAQNSVEFWQNLTAGKESITFFSDVQLQAVGIDQQTLQNPNYVKAHGCLKEIENFDAEFFGYLPREAELIDPQQRIFLEQAWSALEDAGYTSESYAGIVGVFGGVARNGYQSENLAKNSLLKDHLGDYQLTLGNEKDFVATRVAYKLNLKGPALNVQSACSTSGVATHLACQSLLNGECDIALIGGGRIHIPHHEGYWYTEGSTQSDDGHCRAFCADAKGIVRGSGIGVIAVKRLGDAITDNDHVYAVIKSTAINNDGSDKVGFTAPSVDGQAAVITDALEIAGIDADTIQYVEAHGTGTAIGDPVELSALTKAFRETTDKKQFCRIGSVKTNIGHLDAGAGVIGIIKVALSLQHQKIPASLNYRAPNPQIDFENSPFLVNQELIAWPQNNGPRRGAVSTFGLGGTNAHIILEEAPKQAPIGTETANDIPLPILLSAKTKSALQAQISKLASYISANDTQDISDIAFTLAAGRSLFSHRYGLVASNIKEVCSQLANESADDYLLCEEKHRPVVFMFSGQGGQHTGMAKELYEKAEVFRKTIDYCAQHLQTEIGIDIRNFIATDSDDSKGNEQAQDVHAMRFAQPTLFAIEYALAKLWLSWGIKPAALIGHSVGEYTAACIAGMMSLDEGLKLVAARGRLMELTPKGFMLAVALSADEVQDYLVPGVHVATINGAKAVTIAGELAARDQQLAKLENKDIIHKLLTTPIASHTPLMKEMLDPYRAALQEVHWKPPAIPMLLNLTGEWANGPLSADYWCQHLLNPVRFYQGIKVACKDLSPACLEIGPGKALTSLALQLTDSQGAVASLPPESKPEAADTFITKALVALWRLGADIQWASFFSSKAVHRIPLPTYAFQGQRYWVDPDIHLANGNPETKLPLLTTTGAATHAVATKLQTSIPLSARASTQAQLPSQAQTPTSKVMFGLKKLLHELSGIPIERFKEQTGFTDLGFDSLFLTQALAEIQRQFQIDISFRQLFEDAPNLTLLTTYIVDHLPTNSEHLKVEPVTSQEINGGQDGQAYVQAVIDQQLEIMQKQLTLLASGETTELSAVLPTIPASFSTTSIMPTQPPSAEVEKPNDRHGPWRSLEAKKETLNSEQSQAIAALTKRYNQLTAASKNLTSTQRTFLADPRAVTGFRREWKDMIYQLGVERSEGSKIWDIDGNEYIDLTMSFGIALFGHNPTFIKQAITSQLEKGFELGVLTPLAKEAAELFCDVTGMDRVNFVNTGSEALSAAVRIARTVSARHKIAVFNHDYHGISDELLVRPVNRDGEVRSMPVAPGIPQSLVQQVIVLDYDNENFLEVIELHANELAAIIVEPIQAACPGFHPQEQLQALREITDKHNIALIFDELITGFRLSPKGAQGWYGIEADIACYGKILSGCMPLAAVAGQRKYMDAFDGGEWCFGDNSFPEARVTFFGGTFVRHPLSLAATIATLVKIKSDNGKLHQRLNDKTAAFSERVNRLLKELGAPMTMVFGGSIIRFVFTNEQPQHHMFYYHMRLHGIHLTDRAGFLSTAHSDEDLDKIFNSIKLSIIAMQQSKLFPDADVLPEQTETQQGDGIDSLALPLTLSNKQREIWIASAVDKDESAAYNLGTLITLEGELKIDCLKSAISKLLKRHVGLCTTIDADGQQHLVDFSLEDVYSFEDLTDVITSQHLQQQAKLSDLSDKMMTTAFDFEHGPLITIRLLKLDSKLYQLFIIVHHIVCDGISLGILNRDLAQLYNEAQSGATQTALPLTGFRLIAESEATENAAKDTETKDFKFWKLLHTPLPADLDLPTLQGRSKHKTSNSNRVLFPFSDELGKQLEQAASNNHCTAFVFFYAAFVVWLSRLSNKEDIVVGVSVANRTLANQDTVGHFVNMLPVRCQLDESMAFDNFLLHCRGLIFDAFEHQNCSFGSLLSELSVKRRSDHLPLVSVMFNMDVEGKAHEFGNLKYSPQPLAKHRERFELFVNVVKSHHGYSILCTYNTDLFSEDLLLQWLDSYQQILQQATQQMCQPLTALGLVKGSLTPQSINAKGDKLKIPAAVNNCAQFLAGKFSHNVDKCAVAYRGKTLDYQAIEDQSNQLARLLIDRGVTPGTYIGVGINRTQRLPIVLLAIWKAGAAYVPLDPDYPKVRIRYMVEHSKMSHVITGSDLLTYLHNTKLDLISLDLTELESELAQFGSESLNYLGNANNIAYVIYTSGSTGKPKGVEITHHALLNFLLSMQVALEISESDKFLAITTLSFDISILEIFLPLSVGATLVIADRDQSQDGEKLARVIENENITIMQGTPSSWHLLIESEWPGKPGLTAISGGESLPFELANQLLDRSDRLFNMYGPTETTIWSCCCPLHLLDRESLSQVIPIGRPIANTDCYILDKNGSSVAIGVWGELLIGGNGLAKGYIHQPELTAKQFVEIAGHDNTTSRVYRTGDRARWRLDGNIEYGGRFDQQVKVRGFRIELAEIEKALTEFEEVSQSAVTVCGKNADDQRIVAYVVLATQATLNQAEMRNRLKSSLPAYMIPQLLMPLDQLPLTDNGKIDRQQLLEPMQQVNAAQQHVEPEGELEEFLAKLWSEIIGTGSVGRHDDFFDIGGHSLLAMKVVASLKQNLEMKVTLSTLFDNSTLVDFAAALEGILLSEVDSLSDEEAEQLLREDSN